jgi:hypothetical protein
MKFEEPSPKESFDDPRHREREVAARGDEVPFSDVAFGATKEPELRGAKCSVVVKIWASEARRREAREILADHSRHGGLPAEPGTAGARSGTRPARTQGLQPARSRGRVHRQGQTAQALRVRRQGERRHHLEALQGRPVRYPRAGTAGQPLRRKSWREKALTRSDIEHRVRAVYGRQLGIAGSNGGYAYVALFYRKNRLYQVEGNAFVAGGQAEVDAARFQQSLDLT